MKNEKFNIEKDAIKFICKFDKLEALRNKYKIIGIYQFIAILMISASVLFLFIAFVCPFLSFFPRWLYMPMILFILLGMPIISSLLYINNCKWLLSAFLKMNNKLYFIQFQTLCGDAGEEAYMLLTKDKCITTLSKWLNSEKVNANIILLDNIKLERETVRYYYCSYYENNIKKDFKFPKAYPNIKPELEVIKNG